MNLSWPWSWLLILIGLLLLAFPLVVVVLAFVRGGSRRDAARLDERLGGYWIDTRTPVEVEGDVTTYWPYPGPARVVPPPRVAVTPPWEDIDNAD